jgi:hypothetical protein
MGRAPIIRRIVLSVLRNSKNPLRFSEIKADINKALNREVNDKSIVENLTYLVQEGLAEKFVKHNHIVYSLTKSYFSAQAKAMLDTLIEGSKTFDFYSGFEDQSPPYIAFVQKTQNPEIEKRIVYFAPEFLDWEEPISIIASRMLETINEMPVVVQEDIVRFFAYAYWCGVQEGIREYGFNETLPSAIKRCRDFALNTLLKAEEEWKDNRRVNAEKALIEILDLCDELISKSNLLDFLSFLREKTKTVKSLQGVILENVGRYLQGGERIWDGFLEFHELVLSGLNRSGLTPSGRKLGSSKYNERHFYGYSKVWDELIGRVLEPGENKWFNEVKGNSEENVQKVKACAECWEVIKELPFQSKVLITYAWGYPEVFLISDKSFLPWFEEWLEALKQGNLDHRSWIFDRIDKVAKAYRSVKSGKQPADDVIDLEHWTLRDVYLHHPKGKDADFWGEFLSLLNQRNEKIKAHTEGQALPKTRRQGNEKNQVEKTGTN